MNATPSASVQYDLVVRNAALPDGRTAMDIAVRDGRIAAVAPHAELAAARGATELDAQGQLVTPPFVDAHFHMDATLSYGLPRVNASGTLLEGIALWGELKPSLTVEALVDRALAYCDWAVGKGLLAIRSHVDVCDPRLLAVEALLDVRERVRPYLDLQLVAFPQDGLLRSEGALDNLDARARQGRGRRRRHSAFRAHDGRRRGVGAHPLRDRGASAGCASTCTATRPTIRCRGTSRRWRYHTQRLGLPGRVAGSHLTSMHSMDNYYVSKLIPLIAEAGVAAIANPLINITIQGRHDTYPKRRGMTRVPELMAAGVDVAFGHDCVLDPWYPLGSADMLEVAHMGLHVAQMTGQAAMRACFDAVTVDAGADPRARRLRPRAGMPRRLRAAARRATRWRRSGCARRGSPSCAAGASSRARRRRPRRSIFPGGRPRRRTTGSGGDGARFRSS